MPRPRIAQELLRLLHAVDSPLYVVADDRQIAFVNVACAKWLGVSADDLQGRVCRYQSGDVDPIAAAADALCPPPEVFHGQRTSSVICGRNAEGTILRRQAEFIPLTGDDGNVVGALAIVERAEMPEGAEAGDLAGASSRAHRILTAEREEYTSQGELDEARRLHELVQRFRAEMAGRHALERLAGNTVAMQRVRAQVEMAAKCRAAVSIVGPSGSGKQHVARTIHSAGPPPLGALAPVSCAALPAELLQSTLAALASRHKSAQNEPPATLLLTDVHEMPAEVQPEVAKWLSAGTKNLRIIATATEPLSSLIERGRMRGDLAMLLSTLVIDLPPLSARREDIPLIAQMLLEDCNAQQPSKQLRGFTAEAMDRLVAHDWPGQIDELSKVVREAFAVAEGYEITAADLPKRLRLAAEAARFPRRAVEPIDLEKFLAQVETELIDRALRQAKGNKSRAAKLLGLTRPRLYRRMVQLGLAREGE